MTFDPPFGENVRPISGHLAAKPGTQRGLSSTPPGEPPESFMSERLAKLEGQVDGLRSTQEFTLVAVIGVGAILAAFLIGFSLYGLQRIDQLGEKTSAVPNQISVDLRDIT